MEMHVSFRGQSQSLVQAASSVILHTCLAFTAMFVASNPILFWVPCTCAPAADSTALTVTCWPAIPVAWPSMITGADTGVIGVSVFVGVGVGTLVRVPVGVDVGVRVDVLLAVGEGTLIAVAVGV